MSNQTISENAINKEEKIAHKEQNKFKIFNNTKLDDTVYNIGNDFYEIGIKLLSGVVTAVAIFAVAKLCNYGKNIIPYIVQSLLSELNNAPHNDNEPRAGYDDAAVDDQASPSAQFASNLAVISGIAATKPVQHVWQSDEEVDDNLSEHSSSSGELSVGASAGLQLQQQYYVEDIEVESQIGAQDVFSNGVGVLEETQHLGEITEKIKEE